jgi:hypothetical protein
MSAKEVTPQTYDGINTKANEVGDALGVHNNRSAQEYQQQIQIAGQDTLAVLRFLEKSGQKAIGSEVSRNRETLKTFIIDFLRRQKTGEKVHNMVIVRVHDQQRTADFLGFVEVDVVRNPLPPQNILDTGINVRLTPVRLSTIRQFATDSRQQFAAQAAASLAVTGPQTAAESKQLFQDHCKNPDDKTDYAGHMIVPFALLTAAAEDVNTAALTGQILPTILETTQMNVRFQQGADAVATVKKTVHFHDYLPQQALMQQEAHGQSYVYGGPIQTLRFRVNGFDQQQAKQFQIFEVNLPEAEIARVETARQHLSNENIVLLGASVVMKPEQAAQIPQIFSADNLNRPINTVIQEVLKK